jgi:hypothetical protein
MLRLEVDLPSISVLWSRGLLPLGGKGKRLRISGTCFGLCGCLRPLQLRHLLYHLLYVFYGGEGRAFKYHCLATHLTHGCRDLSDAEKRRYVELDGERWRLTRPAGGGENGRWAHWLEALGEWGWKGWRRRNLSAQIDTLEGVMSYAHMVHLRMEARGYSVPPEEAWPIVGPTEAEEELLHPQGHAGYEDSLRLAQFVAVARVQRDHDDACLREVLLERVRFENLQVELFGEPPPDTGPTDFAAGPHEVRHMPD